MVTIFHFCMNYHNFGTLLFKYHIIILALHSYINKFCLSVQIHACIYNLYVLHHTICVFLLIIYCSCASVSFLFGDQWKRHVCPLPVGGAGQWVISADWGSAGLPSTVLGDPEGARWQNTEQVSSTTRCKSAWNHPIFLVKVHLVFFHVFCYLAYSWSVSIGRYVVNI